MSGTDAFDIERLKRELNKLWRFGRNAIVCWSCGEDFAEILAVPQFFLPSLLTNCEDILIRTQEVSHDDLQEISDHCEIEPYRIFCPDIENNKEAVRQLVQRYRVTLKKEKAVILFDTVNFSRFPPLEQVALLNSLSYSLNVARSRAAGRGLRIELACSPTGDGFYVWNRLDGFDANVDLFCLLALALAENAVARESGMFDSVPKLRSCFHVGDAYEYHQAHGDAPGDSSFLVGDATVDAARMVGKALADQIVIGNFVCSAVTDEADGGVMNTLQFCDVGRERLQALNGIVLLRDTIEEIRCYLTGTRTKSASFGITRYLIKDKHDFNHEVFNAKMTLRRKHAESVYLGLRTIDLEDFDVIAQSEIVYEGPVGDALADPGELEDLDERAAGPPKVLIVDDDPYVRDLAVHTVCNAGYEVYSVENGAAAKSFLEERRDISVLLTDVVLPGSISGAELAAYAGRLVPHLKIVFMSGYGEGVIMEKDFDGGARFLQKPFRRDDLLSRLRTAAGGEAPSAVPAGDPGA